jgi:two-component system OmpR family sensor kinase
VSLRLRLALLFALATAALITVAGGLFLYQLRDSLDTALDTGLRARADLVVSRLGSTPAPISPGRPEDIVQVLAADGQVLDSSPAAGATPLLDSAQRRQALTNLVGLTRTVAGDRSRLLAVPAHLAGRPVLAVVGTGTEVSDAAEERIRAALFFGGPPSVLLSGVAAWLLAGAALRPVERMRRQVADITETDRDAQLAVPATRDEVAALARTMNALLARLQRALARERGFVADAGHELRTPLAILRTELELAARPGRTREALVEAIGNAADETDRISRLAEDLLLLARADDGRDFLRRAPVAVTELLGAAVRGAALRGENGRVAVRLHLPVQLPAIDGDAGRLRQAVDNLLDNALRYAPPGSCVDVAVTTTARGDEPIVVIEVTDSGPGFAADFLPLAFERFHRADDARARASGGAGLGLAIVRSIALAHGGRAVVANRPTGGARVAIELPTGCPDVVGPGGAGEAQGAAEFSDRT